MALSGSVTTSVYSGRSITLNWTATQPTGENKSRVSWELIGSGSAGGYVMVGEIKVTINGIQAYYRNSSVHTNCYKNQAVTKPDGTAIKGTVEIPHKSDGTKSFTVKVEAGIYMYAINCSGSATFTLNKIALASSISSASNVTLGNNCQITWTPAATSYTYRLGFSLGEWSYTTGAILPNQTSTYTYSGYQIPIDVAYQLPNSSTGIMTVLLYTYSDSAGTKQIGATSTKTFTVTVPNTIKPIITSVTTTIDNSGNATVQGWGIALCNITKVNVQATVDLSGIYGASVSYYTISGGYNEIIKSQSDSLNYTGGAVTTSGDKTFSVIVTDSRGNNSEAITASPAITFNSYDEPSISSFSAQRIYSPVTEGRTSVKVKGNWSYDDINGNSVTATLIYKKRGGTGNSWSGYHNITANMNEWVTITFPEGGSSAVGFPETDAYDFRLVVRDSFGKQAINQVLVPTAEVLLDFKPGGKGLGVGRVAESDRMEVGLDAMFFKSIKLFDFGVETTLEDYILSLARSLTAPQIMVQPVGATITLGDTISLSLKARGVGLTYQWYFKKSGQSSFSIWDGRTGASETVTPNATWDGIQLYCAITDSNGNVANSDIITITVNQE